ncbi:ATP-dependent zinc metalloprotease FtsH [Paraburkholderia caffeinitolerans]|uniref:ATP-dependent zinc metalloprotease FtsH n=1 Tax=Paraburkholderia caffeinitolerans TaxID=1723730 RepID=A0A6J5GQA7_9BURK|nr:ATP-binding protein [Paraburkholderia caffeinitolerans]CAB3803404.1 ATP-dependent zinc metalloprotease FtsH [Paraburkholderia caffeinitolerans]
MNTATAPTWQEVNSRYLAAALAWLKIRLERHARQQPGGSTEVAAPSVPAPPPATGTEPAHWWQRRSSSAVAPETPATQAPPPLPAPSSDDVLARAAAEYAAAAAQTNPAPILMRLSALLELSQFEREILLLCTAMELDPDIAGLCELAQGHTGHAYPTFALALALFDDAAWDALSPQNSLRYWRLIEIHQSRSQPLSVSPIRADERIVQFIQGMDYLDDRLAMLVSAVPAADDGDLPPSYVVQVDTIVHRLQQAAPAGMVPLVQLAGYDSASKAFIAALVARRLGVHLYRLPAEAIPADARELETLQRLWQRESVMLPLALYVDAPRAETGPRTPAELGRLLSAIGGISFVDAAEPVPLAARDSFVVDVDKPDTDEQEALWNAVLGPVLGQNGSPPPAIAAQLASQFKLGVEDIRRIAKTVAVDDAAGGAAPAERLWDACLEVTRPRLDQLAQRLTPKAGWDDLVLPAAESSLLHQIAGQVDSRSQVYRSWGFAERMSRGLGISALFAGESGTGKTMAAEVIASELRLNLYRIDLSAVVSKYIGETEKNLRRLFDAAEDGGAILFFDEADALFGKRSEVKDSHDRYANIEINYLLQRMEAYRGLAILATNLKSALDQAFLRRLRFIVTFPFPAYAERKSMWEKVFPPRAPTSGLDFDALAQLNLTGGNIHSIALNAAFAAARAGTPVTQALVLDASRTELKKLGRTVNELEFRRQGKLGAA